MKPGRGKHKGGGYERLIGARLSLWLSRGERKDLICRTVGSGAQFTFSKCGNAGDLMAQHPLAFTLCDKYVIECKFWRLLSMHHFLQGKGELWDAWEKVNREAVVVKKSPWLIARQNHQPDLLICHPKPSFTDLLPISHLLFNGQIQLFQLEAFLSIVNPEKFLSV